MTDHTEGGEWPRVSLFRYPACFKVDPSWPTTDLANAGEQESEVYVPASELEAAEEEVRGLRARLKKDADFWLGLAASEVEPGERESDVDFGYSEALRSCAESVLAALKSAGEGEAS
jgi:hypothetical protein